MKTKKVRLHISALTRVANSKVIEVPADMDHYELTKKVREFYDTNEDWVEDNEYFEMGGCYYEEVKDE